MYIYNTRYEYDMRWLEAFSLSVNLWERSKLQSLQLDDYFAGQQQLAFCLVSFGPGPPSTLSRSGLFVSSSATNQSGDLPWLFCQLKLFSTVEYSWILPGTLKTLQLWKQTPSGIKYVDINKPSSTTATRILQFLFSREEQLLFEDLSSMQSDSWTCWMSLSLPSNDFSDFRAAAAEIMFQTSVHKGPLNPVMTSHKIG